MVSTSSLFVADLKILRGWDMEMRSIFLGKKGADFRYILQNVVYLELLRRGYTVYIDLIR